MNMYPRTNYEMTEDDLKSLLDACKPTVCIKIGSYEGSSPQENANRAWQSLGEKMGFDYMSVQPQEGKGMRFFSAVPSENQTQRNERIAQEERESREREKAVLKERIKVAQRELDQLEAMPAR